MAERAHANRLRAMAEAGTELKIILDWCDCGSDPPHGLSGCEACKACKALPPVTDPKHFHIADVTEIEKSAGDGDIYIAHAADGSYTMGRAEDLLRRLRHWDTESSAASAE